MRRAMHASSNTTDIQPSRGSQGKIIRIYHECEGRIEKSVTRVVVWHLEACRVMINGVPEGRIFQSYPHTNNEFFFLSPLF